MTLLLDDPPTQRAAPRRDRLRTASVLLPALLAAALTALRYDAKPLWRDEVYTLSTAGRSLPDMMGLLSERDAGLVGYYTLMHPWLLVSEASWWIRLPGAVATVVLVALVAVLGRRVGGSAVGLVAGLLAAVAPATWVHGQEARPYPLALTAVVVVALLLLRGRERPRAWRWLVAGLVAVLAAFLHPLVTVPSLGAVYAATWWRPGRAPRWALVASAVPAAVVGAALVRAGAAQAAERPPARATLGEYATFWKLLADELWLGGPLMALAVVGAVLLVRRARAARAAGSAGPAGAHDVRPWLLPLWAATPIAAVTTLGLIGSYFNSRYASAAVPALCVLVAVALVALPGLLLRRSAGRRFRGHRLLAGRPRAAAAVGAVVVAVLVALLLPAAVSYRTQSAGWDDPKGAALELSAGAQPGDAVVWVGNVVRPLVTAYLPAGLEGSDRLHDALLLSSPEDSDTLGGLQIPRRERVGALEPYSRVWLVGSVATATDDLDRTSASSKAVMEGRRLVSSTDHGHLRVELWVTASPSTAPAPPGVPQ